MKKAIQRLAGLVTLVLLLSALPMAVSAASCSHDSTNPTSAVPEELTEGTYVLEEGAAASDAITVSGEVTLCLNGQTLTAPGELTSGSFITVGEGATLTICGDGTISGSGTSGVRGVEVQSGGTLILESGTISGFAKGTTSGNTGGGVYVTGGTFTMNGGTITNNKANQGGGVYLSGGTFTMKNGTISLNESNTSSGGGVYLASNAVFTMKAGSIINNTAKYNGGGVYINKSKFTMEAGDITGNTANGGADAETGGNGGGGVYCTNGTFEMEKGTVANNVATAGPGGGILIAGAGVLTVSGGTIGGTELPVDGSTLKTERTANMGNYAKYFGGGIHVSASGSVTLSGGNISYNYCAENGGGIHMGAAGTVQVDSGSIDNNKAGGGGGGVYAYNGGSVTLTGGSINNNICNSIYGGGVCVRKGTINMSGSARIYWNDSTSASHRGEQVAVGTTNGTSGVECAFTMSGGSVEAKSADANAIMVNRGTFTLEQDGVVTGGIANRGYNHTNASATTEIKGGSVNGSLANDIDSLGGKCTLTISGGKFSGDTERSELVGFLDSNATNLSLLPINENGLIYEVGTGYVRTGEFMDFKSSLDLTITLGADVGFKAEGVTATVNGSSITPTVGESSIIIPISGIVAKAMDDEYTVVVTDGTNTLYSETLSVRKLAGEWYADASHADAKTMLEDMVNYGIQAQQTFEGEESMTTLGSGTASAPTWTATEGAGVTTGYEDKVAVTLSLKEQIELNVYVNDADATVTAVEGADAPEVEHENNITRISFRDIPVVNIKNAVSFKVNLDESTSFDVTYSIKDYVINALADTNNGQKDLLEALQKYVDAVSAYVTQAQ